MYNSNRTGRCVICVRSSYHDHLAILDFSDELGLFAVPLLDVDQLVSIHGHRGLKDKREECFKQVRRKISALRCCQMLVYIRASGDIESCQ